MKKEYFILALFFFSCTVWAGGASTTVTSKFVITNRTIESADISSTDGSMTYSDETGSGLYRIHDNYSSATVTDLAAYKFNHQLSLYRRASKVDITLKGVNLGHIITVKGKLANSSVIVPNYTGSFFGDPTPNYGCSLVSPTGSAGGLNSINFVITSSNDVTKDCAGRPQYYIFRDNPPRPQGSSRDFYLDIGRLQSDPDYRKAPPDIYVGTGKLDADVFKTHWNTNINYFLSYINNITIIKNPYFENVTLPSGDNNTFSVKNVGNEVRGELVIPYVINGYFTPYNTITLSVSSLNNFRLKDTSLHEIPYSLSTGIGSQKEYSLVTAGTYHAPIKLTNLTNENHSLQGRFNASFSVNKNIVSSGDYTDTLTAIFEIAL